jgi:hypothetical protein
MGIRQETATSLALMPSSLAQVTSCISLRSSRSDRPASLYSFQDVTSNQCLKPRG